MALLSFTPQGVPVRLPKTVPAAINLFNHGTKTKERRKPRLRAYSLTKNRNGHSPGGRVISGWLPAEAAATNKLNV